MPSIELELGRYVTTRPRKDGTHRVFFQVPKRLAPADWPSLIPLPIQGARAGNLADADEVARIQADAKALYKQLNGSRLGRSQPQGRTFRALRRHYEESAAWLTEIKPKTRASYTTYLNHVERWSEIGRAHV